MDRLWIDYKFFRFDDTKFSSAVDEFVFVML